MALRSLLASEERRDLGVAQAGIEIRAAAVEPDAEPDEDDTPQIFTGHAAVFNVRTAIGNPITWGFYEQITDGAFTKTLNEGDARFLVDHESSMVIARVSADTLRLSQDKIGLATDADLNPKLSYVSDLIVNLDSRNITGMSFGFYVVKDQWDSETVELSDGNETEVEIRTILEVKLLEVSAVTFPAYEETDAGLRALAYRHDRAAIEKRVPYMPSMSKLLADIDREPGESTRGDEASEPAASTRLSVASVAMRRKALEARFPDLARI